MGDFGGFLGHIGFRLFGLAFKIYVAALYLDLPSDDALPA